MRYDQTMIYSLYDNVDMHFFFLSYSSHFLLFKTFLFLASKLKKKNYNRITFLTYSTYSKKG